MLQSKLMMGQFPTVSGLLLKPRNQQELRQCKQGYLKLAQPRQLILQGRWAVLHCMSLLGMAGDGSSSCGIVSSLT